MMMDLMFVAATAMFYIVAICYVRGCERLK
jgi:hypothetical protein